MIFDTHTNILSQILQERNYISETHLPMALEGHITGGVWTLSSSEGDLDSSINQILSALNAVKELHIVKSKDDWDIDAFNVVLGLQDIGILQERTTIHNIYEQGFRHASIAQSESGFVHSGLTQAGRKLIHYMATLGMVIDVTGADNETLADIISETDLPIVATAANCHGLMPYKQNLQDAQIKAIADTGGFIGVTTTNKTVHTMKPCVETLVDHIDYLKNLVGTSYISLGFNFTPRPVLQDCRHAGHAIHVIDELYKRNYTTTEIEAIASVNAKRVINQILK